jgi:hypothetical protein
MGAVTEQPFNEGYDARFSGNADRHENPYADGTKDHCAWDHGWVNAEEEAEDA